VIQENGSDTGGWKRYRRVEMIHEVGSDNIFALFS